MEFSHCYNASFCWRVETRGRTYKGFGQNCPNPLHLHKAILP